MKERLTWTVKERDALRAKFPGMKDEWLKGFVLENTCFGFGTEEQVLKQIEEWDMNPALTHLKRLEGEFRQNANYLERSMKQFPDNRQFFGAWSEANECADRIAAAIKEVEGDKNNLTPEMKKTIQTEQSK